ncbi:MAG TPA: aromatic ring-hydroxylating dioxygenase subunit alpha, partial [Chloroflexota bacterium]|nr:aromatic ring-hydroxylating dioxygenase subunit alpha [Chloroflexota bacterium]
YLRTFWQPLSRSQDLQPGQALPVTIMSESLTLYRGESGHAHAIASRCAHRGTQLSTGWVEGDCVRCLYHGWKYDASGQCVEQPGEDENFAAKVRIRSYPVQEYAGLVFAYLGEGEPPPLRHFPDLEREGVLSAGVPEVWPCNYFNRVDNAPDMGHVPWTHRESLSRIGSVRPTATEWYAEETEYGLKTICSGLGLRPQQLYFHMPNINQNRSVGRVEGTLQDAANLWVDRFFWRVPIDDGHCVSFVVDWLPLTGEEGLAYLGRRNQAEQRDAPLQELGQAILAGKMRLRDLDPEMSTYKLFWIEDYVIQCGQGTIAPRDNDRLGRIDTGLIQLRRLWQRELKALAEGRPLKHWTEPAGLADSGDPSRLTAVTAGA